MIIHSCRGELPSHRGVPTTPGSCSPDARVTDTNGAMVRASSFVQAGPPAVPTSTNPANSVPMWEFEAALAGLAIAAALAVVLLVLSRRRAPPRGAEP